MDRRLEELDGLRTVAIAIVALYHYAVFWAPAGRGLPLLPYGDALAWIPVHTLGGVGVSLFFVISGLVIAISLERARGLRHFAMLRAIRLWPGFLVCGALTVAATWALGPQELQRGWAEAAVSLLFLPPEHVGAALGIAGWEWLDGAYWSLWVEVRFYAVAALIFLGTGRLLEGWLVFALVGLFVHAAALSGHAGADALGGLLFAEHHPYFTAGIALACLVRGRTPWLARAVLVLAAGQALIYARADGADTIRMTCEIAILLFAVTAALAPRLLPWLRARPMVAMGQASYPFYLLHQNFGLALLLALPVMPAPLSVAAAIVVLAGIAVLSLALHFGLERPLGRALRRRLLRPAAASATDTGQPRPVPAE